MIFHGKYHSFSLKYLGVTMNRFLTFKKHLEKPPKKIRFRVNLLQKPVGMGLGTDANTLKTTSLV